MQLINQIHRTDQGSGNGLNQVVTHTSSKLCIPSYIIQTHNGEDREAGAQIYLPSYPFISSPNCSLLPISILIVPLSLALSFFLCVYACQLLS